MTTIGTHDLPLWRHMLRHAVREESPSCWGDITQSRRREIVRAYLRENDVPASDWLSGHDETGLRIAVTIGPPFAFEGASLLRELSERAETWVSLAVVDVLAEEIDKHQALLRSSENVAACAADAARKEAMA